MPYADPERQREYDRQKYRRRLAVDPEATREAQRLRVKRWHEQHPEAKRGYALKSRYGISAETYDEMLERQGGVCAICREECKTGKALAVDHNAETGKVRGLLCRACNGGIGSMGDSVENLQRAIGYLREHQE
jgi:hypothetical protein